ncbi:hypothetical protein PILCRDRAFT_812734 [Piloderma croceum F 1598]|uniref:Uncharacterized protein n=1 Tax=Piloderma croceum (strain F 1598) TaxID=765440 RepID=A0A0C3GH49_PILCF|nr:hypothetical protein PILCRDRAFT_812734 [Piloderma croceum F 1598]
MAIKYEHNTTNLVSMSSTHWHLLDNSYVALRAHLVPVVLQQQQRRPFLDFGTLTRLKGAHGVGNTNGPGST